jgi:hypothetical protein
MSMIWSDSALGINSDASVTPPAYENSNSLVFEVGLPKTDNLTKGAGFFLASGLG